MTILGIFSVFFIFSSYFLLRSVVFILLSYASMIFASSEIYWKTNLTNYYYYYYYYYIKNLRGIFFFNDEASCFWCVYVSRCQGPREDQLIILIYRCIYILKAKTLWSPKISKQIKLIENKKLYVHI